MITVKLPAEIAAHSPDFLDYLYALPSDSKFTINFENSKSMKSLANYFFIPRLIEDLAEFIEEDMKNYLIEHMEEYICELNSDTSDELSLLILPNAVLVCAKMIQSIDVDSSLLISIPHAMFHQIIQMIAGGIYDGSNCQMQSCSLLLITWNTMTKTKYSV